MRLPVRLRSLRTSPLCKLIMLLSCVIAPLCFFVPSQSTSDFHTLDGDDNEEILTGQSKSFFLRKEYSLTKPFQGPWNLAGSALVTGDFVRLTPDSQSRRGAIWSRLPVHIRHWEARVNFRVHGTTGKHFGDGLAFWYVRPAAHFPGPMFGGQERFSGLAVLLDTYSNQHGPQGHFHPYVSAIVNNGSVAFNHEDDGEQKAPVGCTARFRNREHETQVAIRYVDGTLTVSTNVDDRSGWQRCFRVARVRLPTHYVFGLSAMTGDLSDNHDILSMKVYEVESTENPDDYSSSYKSIEPAIEGLVPVEDSQQVSPSASEGLILGLSPSLLALLLLLASLAGLALYLYHGKRRRQKTRFY